MISSLFPLPIELTWLMAQLRQYQPELFAFVDIYSASFVLKDIKDCERTTRILYTAIAPHFREERKLLEANIKAKAIIAVRDEYLGNSVAWSRAQKKLIKQLSERGVYRTSSRRVAHDHLAANFFPRDGHGPKDRRNAEILFLSIWEMEAQQLESEEKCLTP